jgi:DNA-binding MarR family transcriptional regulator
MASSATAGRKRSASTTADPAARVLRRFRTVFSAVRNHFRSVEKSAGISGAQVWALSQVAAHPGVGVGQLARAMDIHQSTASNLVRTLLEAKLVVSEKGETDRRAVHLHATARGLKILAKAPAPLTGLLPDALQRLDAATLQRMDRDLARLIRELKADPDAANVLIGGSD